MLFDLKAPQGGGYSIASALAAGEVAGELKIPKQHRSLLTFALVSVTQTLFPLKDQSLALFGYDINDKYQRDEVLGMLIDDLFARFEHDS